MSAHELWVLRDEITKVLRLKIAKEKQELERRLTLLKNNPEKVGMSGRRQPYPKLPPKYRNPTKPSETWSGRGRRPKWVIEQLQSGMKLDDLAV
jgi:DNA-binding protein H-NS